MEIRIRCPDCRSPFAEAPAAGVVQNCPRCGFQARWQDGVLRLLPSHSRDDEADQHMSALCSGSDFYRRLSQLKTGFERPPAFPIAEAVNGKAVLSLGCGPTLRGVHQNYDFHQAELLVGLDVHQPFLRDIRRENPGPGFLFVQGSAYTIPFPDHSFDTTLALFVVHHLPDDLERVFAEINRVTRRNVIVFDHIRSDVPILAKLQKLYWKWSDGGCSYLSWPEWQHLFAGLTLGNIQRSGPFGQVFRAILSKPHD